MSLTLKIVGRHRQALGELAEKTFGQDGGTIGRSLDSDWSLPDGQRFLSSRHASIDFRSGCYYIVDTSKNGVFINGAEDPVGHGKPQRLFAGDKLRIGEYEMEVSIANVDDTRETLLSTSHVDPVDLKQRVEAPDPTSYNLVDEQAITGVGIEMYLEEDEIETLKPLYDKYRTGDSSSNIKAPPPAKSPDAHGKPATNGRAEKQVRSPKVSAPTPAPKATASKSAAPKSATPKSTTSKGPAAQSIPAISGAPAAASAKPSASARSEPGATRNPVEAFFRGAGIDAPVLSDKAAEQLMTQLGQVTRELIVGVIDCLHLRALQKAQLKQSNTTIQPLDNNRLKFAANVEEGFARLFGDDSEQYLSPVESVRKTFADLKRHQRSLLVGTRRALDEYLDRLACDPRSGGRDLTVTGALMKVYEGPGAIAQMANARVVPVRIDGDLDPACRLIFRELMAHHKGNWAEVVRHIRVRRWLQETTLVVVPILHLIQSQSHLCLVLAF